VTNTIQQDGQQARFVVCYPNPAAEKVMVSLNNNMPQYSKKEKIVSVRITDQMGQVVLASKTLNVMDAQIDVSALETGVYLVVVKNELGIETTGRLVKID
jgi:hypothetical protein